MKKVFNVKSILILCLVLIPGLVFAETGTHDSHNITHMMMKLVFEIGIIIFAAKYGGMLFEKLRFPSVLGELTVGIIIGPYLLGAVALPGFPEGLFPINTLTAIPVSPELYGIATIASIILLFGAGLETDFNMFLKFSLVGTILGIGGVVVSFVVADVTAMYFLDVQFMNPKALFIGVMSTATSVGITARILSERRKMDSPEGVSIMAGAVIDDILGIIILAIIIGITVASRTTGSTTVDWTSIGFIALKAISVWLVFTLLGLIFAHRISKFLKVFRGVSTFSVLSLGLAFVLAAVFEKAGLAMIVGAYVMGLSLSRTDLSHVIHDKLNTIRLFFVPIFFTVMGMLVDPTSFASKEVITFGLVYTLGAILAKIIGCGIPARFLKFNWVGSMRIGLGMVPRGEVALIIAGVGLTNNILNKQEFGVAIMMTLLTTVVAPPILNIFLKIDKRGTIKEIKSGEKISTIYEFPSEESVEMVEIKLVENFRNEGFFVNVIELKNEKVYHVLKDEIVFSIIIESEKIVFKSDKEDVPFIKNVVYETLLNLYEIVSQLKTLEKPAEMRKDIVAKGRSNVNEIIKIINPKCILVGMKAKNKEDIINQLVDLLHRNNEIEEKEKVLSEIMKREESMSTGLTDGLAIPHAKCDFVNSVKLAIGIIEDGIDFESIDGQPTTIITLILSPKSEHSAHLQVMSNISSIFSEQENREKIIKCKNSHEIMEFLESK